MTTTLVTTTNKHDIVARMHSDNKWQYIHWWWVIMMDLRQRMSHIRHTLIHL